MFLDKTVLLLKLINFWLDRESTIFLCWKLRVQLGAVAGPGGLIAVAGRAATRAVIVWAIPGGARNSSASEGHGHDRELHAQE